MEIQQHDGVVVEVAGIPAGLRQAQAGRKKSHGREREAPGLRSCCPPSPTIYRAKGEGGAQPCPFLQGRVRPGGSPSPPRHLGGAFPL